jgi:hypothetical protein
MRQILCFFLIVTLSGVPVWGQLRGPMREMFQGQPPPPGAVTVLGRSVIGSLQNGFGNSLLMLFGSDNQNIRQELGITDAEASSMQLVRAQMLLNVPKYAARFQKMTEADFQSVQEDLERDMGKITEFVDNSLSEERRAKVQKLAFQSLGGIDSPMISLHSMEVLNLSEDQKKKLKGTFDEMYKERESQMEAGLKLMEKAIALGGPNMSPEDREKLEKERRELEAQIFATGKTLAERLRQHLTAEQLEQEKQLLASRPAFLPKLPKQMQANTESGSGGYTPGADAWRPGQELPFPVQQRRGRFPRAEPE